MASTVAGWSKHATNPAIPFGGAIPSVGTRFLGTFASFMQAPSFDVALFSCKPDLENIQQEPKGVLPLQCKRKKN